MTPSTVHGNGIDDIARIERRMEARRAMIREHVEDARDNVVRSIRPWPIVLLAVAIAAGYVAARPRPAGKLLAASRPMRVSQAAKRAGPRFASAVALATTAARMWPQVRTLIAAIARPR